MAPGPGQIAVQVVLARPANRANASIENMDRAVRHAIDKAVHVKRSGPLPARVRSPPPPARAAA